LNRYRFPAERRDASHHLEFISDSAAHFGKIDVLVNNAGLERHADFWDVTEADYDIVLNVNLKGVFFITLPLSGMAGSSRAVAR
jgi:glucose 1-dehydrogenase